MVDINFLDKLLNYLRENDGIGLSDSFDTDFTKEENKYLRQAAERLENDGYAQSIGKYQFFITFDGLIALDETFLGKYKNQPYKRIQIKSRWNNAWLAIKVVVTVIHGVALLILAALAIDEIRSLFNRLFL